MRQTQPSLPQPSLLDAISRRGLICAACVAVVAITIVLLADTNLPIVVYRLIVDGGVCALWLAAAVGWGAVNQRIFKHRIAVDLLDFVNSAALGIGLLSLVILGLGLAGWLNRITSWVLIAMGVAQLLVTLGPRSFDSRAMKAWFAQSSRANWLWIVAMPALGIALVASIVPPGILWGDEPHGYDVVEYHLQVPREWYEAGRIVPLKHNVFSYMPMNVELHYLLAMQLRGGPWAGMYVAQRMHLTLIAMSVLAIFALAREPAGPPAATVSGIAMVAAPWLLLLAPIAYNEGGLLFFGAMSIGWVWRAIRDPEESNWKCWALAGAFAGFACGTKLTAVPMLLIGIPIAALVARAKIQSLAVFAIAGIAMFAPWLVRNQIWAGNPVFPEAMSVLGRAHFTEDQQERWRRAHSPTEQQRSFVARARAGVDQITIDWRYGYALIPLAIIAIALSRRREAWFIAALLAIFLIVWIGFTHLQSRFFVLAIPACALAIAGLRFQRAAAAIIVIVTIVGMIKLRAQYLSRDSRPPGQLATMLDAGVLGVAEFPNLYESVPPDATLILIGDARAFVYDRPIRYRTVFDVAQAPGQSIVDAWAGGNIPRGSYLLIAPSELDRMTKYWKIGAPDPDIASRNEPFIIQR